MNKTFKKISSIMGFDGFAKYPAATATAFRFFLLLLKRFLYVGLALLAVLIIAAVTYGFFSSLPVLGNFLGVAYRRIDLLSVFFVAVGGLWMVWLTFQQMALSTEAASAAAESLLSEDEAPIRLQPGMETLEAKLNEAKSRSRLNTLAAKTAEQRKNDLVVYLAHDLKTPLTSVIGYLELLKEEPDLSAETRTRYTGIAYDKALRLEDLINEFFEITRFNLSQLSLEKSELDVTRLLQQMLSENEPALAERGLCANLSAPPALPLVADPDKLQRVLDNLLRNAISYSTPGSEIKVRAQKTFFGDVQMQFENRGPTIPPEKLSRIFEQFYRLDSARATGRGGAGLGLAIAKQLIERHGGTISADSKGGVTLFTVSLPAVGKETAEAFSADTVAIPLTAPAAQPASPSVTKP